MNLSDHSESIHKSIQNLQKGVPALLPANLPRTHRSPAPGKAGHHTDTVKPSLQFNAAQHRVKYPYTRYARERTCPPAPIDPSMPATHLPLHSWTYPCPPRTWTHLPPALLDLSVPTTYMDTPNPCTDGFIRVQCVSRHGPPLQRTCIPSNVTPQFPPVC